MRVLFLDFDGVLNCRDYVHAADWQPPLGSERDVNIIDPLAVALLNMIVEATDAFVVVSSSWRMTYDLAALRSILTERGFRGRVLGVTPVLPSHRRCREIAQWLEDNSVEAFAIVDDDADAGTGHGEAFVRTTFEEGITPAHAKRVSEILLRAPRGRPG